MTEHEQQTIDVLVKDIQDIWDAEYHSGRFNNRLSGLLFSDYERLTDLIEDKLKQALTQANKEWKAEELEKLKMVLPKYREENSHQSYNEGKIDMSEQILSALDLPSLQDTEEEQL